MSDWEGAVVPRPIFQGPKLAMPFPQPRFLIGEPGPTVKQAAVNLVQISGWKALAKVLPPAGELA